MKVVPQNRIGDYFVSIFSFIRAHRRFPRKGLLFNDYLFHIKTSNDILEPSKAFTSDKEFLKLYAESKVGEKHIIPTVKILRNPEEVDDYDFPVQCCIKPTHASGRVILRENGEEINSEEIKSWFSLDYYLIGREANYKNLSKKVIVEPLIFNNSNVRDFKFFCFQGKPKFIQIDIDRFNNHKRNFFSLDWNDLNFSMVYERSEKEIAKPTNLDEMIFIANKLCVDFEFVRVDLYTDGKKCLVGELTHLPENVEGKFIPLSSEILVSEILFMS